MSGLYESVMNAVALLNQVPLTDVRLVDAHSLLRKALIEFPPQDLPAPSSRVSIKRRTRADYGLDDPHGLPDPYSKGHLDGFNEAIREMRRAEQGQTNG
ncbi:TPA: hypothetical protein ACGCGJ_000439 [Stenotrophomonas maltophilia]|uniref:hypothetical protein n=1 Tax=Stenotrophomonas TaxID=40323 RepID=UPI000DA8ADDA|nr:MULTISPECIES: hypothetical protein [Stenotrophomonas]PZS96361.1 hypothetical protein A7X66_09345 [Stenotrophomonas maltophilia]